jgi:myo-inositol-1(or 4)-monophosphatase
MKSFLEQIVLAAGEEIRGRFRGSFGLKSKAYESDFVTDADHAANEVIVKAIRATYPEHGIISEEAEADHADAEHIWIIDPLDGTHNFARGMALFGTMIAFAHNGRVQAAVIYDPIADELLSAERGKGTRLNGVSVSCATTTDWAKAFGCANARWAPGKNAFLHALIDVTDSESSWISTFGSAATNAISVATGRRDWYFSVDSKIWDYAAPSLIAEESGCTVSDREGRPWSFESTSLVVAVPALHPRLLSLAQKAYQ